MRMYKLKDEYASQREHPKFKEIEDRSPKEIVDIQKIPNLPGYMTPREEMNFCPKNKIF